MQSVDSSVRHLVESLDVEQILPLGYAVKQQGPVGGITQGQNLLHIEGFDQMSDA